VHSHRSLPEGTLEAVGLLPRRRRKQRELLAELTRDASSALITPPPPLANGVAPSASEKEAEHQEQGEPAPKEEAGQEGPSEPTVEEDVGPAGECDQGAEEGKDHPTGRPVLRRYSPRHETIPGSARGPAAAPTEKGTTHFNEVVEGILAALALELLPPLALGTAGWILHRLLSSSGGAAELEPAWQEQLDAVIAKRRAVVRPQVCGLWGDAVLPLAGMLWSRNRSVVLRTGAGPLHVAAQAWVQGILLQELHWQLGGAREQVTASNATTAAKLVCASVQALVGVLQIKEVSA